MLKKRAGIGVEARTDDGMGRPAVAAAPETAERTEALAIIHDWRAAHGFPLNTFQGLLRKRSLKVDSDAITAQRLKRVSSIEAKLHLPWCRSTI